MSRQTDLLELNNSLDTKHYTFTLYNEFFGTRVLEYAPGSWDDDEFQFSRDMKSFGVFRKFAGSVLNFYKDGRDFLRNVYEGYGPNADCTLTVTEFTPWRVTKTRFVGKIDFSSYEITELSVNVKVIDGSFTDKVLSRAKIKVDLTKSESIDSKPITPAILSKISIPEIKIYNIGQLYIGDSSIRTWTGWHVVPVTEIWSQFDELQIPDQNRFTVTSAFFNNSLISRVDVKVVTQLLVDVTSASTGFNVNLQRCNGGVTVELLFADVYAFTGSQRVDYYSEFIINTVNVGDYFVLTLTTADTSINFYYHSAKITVSDELSNVPAKIIYAPLYSEVLRATIAHYSGEDNAISSTIFDSVHLGAVIPSNYLKNLNQLNNSISASLDDEFTSLRLLNIGMGIEVIGGVEKVVFEPMEHFFNTNLILDLSNRIDFSTIEKKVETSLFANRISIGFGTYVYNTNAGIFEFNTSSSWSTVIKAIDNEFNLTAVFRGDPSGMIEALTPVLDSNDIRTDDNLFMLDLISDGSTGYIPRTDEGFDNIFGTVYSSKLFNLMYSPSRTLRRWGRYISAFLKWDMSSMIKWQKSDKNTTLGTQLTGESAIYENADIPVTELRTPVWIPETYELEVPIDTNDFDAISANPYGLFKIGPDTYGYLLDYKAKNENNKSSFKLLRYNNAYGPVLPSAIPPVNYGSLFNHFAASDYCTIANDGWRLPDTADFNDLEANIALNPVNFLNFKAIGYRGIDGSFVASPISCVFWNLDQSSCLEIGIIGNDISTSRAAYNQKIGNNIRLIKDSTSLTDGQYSTYTGNDGRIYRTLCVATKEWMLDNLAETEFRYNHILTNLTVDRPESGYYTFLYLDQSNGTTHEIEIVLDESTTIEDVYDQLIADSTYIALNEDGKWVLLFDTDGMHQFSKSTIAYQNAEYFDESLIQSKQIPYITDNAAWAALTTPARCYYNNDPLNA